MAFRYINPGYIAFLDSDCVATEVANSTYSKTGVGFTQTNEKKGVTLPTFNIGDDFYIRFDAYIPNSSSGTIKICSPYTQRGGIKFYYPNSGNSYLYIYLASGDTSYILFNGTFANSGLIYGQINTIVVYVVSGASGSIDLTINNKHFALSNVSIQTSTNYQKNAIIYSDSATISNLIISDAEISPKERIIALPIGATQTDMTAGASGIYLADAVNQTLLQSADVSTLVENYGETSKVTGIALVGNPAYKTGTAITTLTGLSKSGGVVTEHAICELSEDTTAVIMDDWGMSGVTIADLQGMQFGWKAGE